MPPITRRMSRISNAESSPERSASSEVGDNTSVRSRRSTPAQLVEPTYEQNAEKPLPAYAGARAVSEPMVEEVELPIPSEPTVRMAPEQLAEEIEEMDLDEVTAALHRSDDEEEEFVGEGEEGEEDDEGEGSEEEGTDEGEGEGEKEKGEEEDAEGGRYAEAEAEEDEEDEEEVETGEETGADEDEEDEREPEPSELVIVNDPETKPSKRPTSIPAAESTIAYPQPAAAAAYNPENVRHGAKITYVCANVRPVQYVPGKFEACGREQEKGRGESLRCIGCGCPVLMKVRTNKMVQFQAI